MTVIVDIQHAYEGESPKIELFHRWAEAALHEVKENCELSIRLVDIAESRDLNSNYRDKSGPTNVLSFSFDSPLSMVPRLLGDLVICVPVVEKEAIEQGKNVEHHWAHLVVHGCLHLLGYDHIEDDDAIIMEEAEITILKILDIDNPYSEQEMTS